MVSFTTAIKNGFKKTFDFSGRATRAEYWWWALFVWIAMFVVILPGAILSEFDDDLILVGIVPMLVVYCATIIPSLSLFVRRLHDGGNSGWYLLWNLLPYIGSFIVFLATLEKSESDNKYGPNPNKKAKNEPTNSENNGVKKNEERGNRTSISLTIPKRKSL